LRVLFRRHLGTCKRIRHYWFHQYPGPRQVLQGHNSNFVSTTTFNFFWGPLEKNPLRSLQLGCHWSIFKFGLVVGIRFYRIFWAWNAAKKDYMGVPLILGFMRANRSTGTYNYDVKLMWIPSRVRISGNEVADGLARHAVRQ
jgi:hypothetical protein